MDPLFPPPGPPGETPEQCRERELKFYQDLFVGIANQSRDPSAFENRNNLLAARDKEEKKIRQNEWPKRVLQAQRLAQQDMSAITRRLRCAKRRKTVPAHSVPNEILTLIFCPNHGFVLRGQGLGFRRPDVTNESIRRVFFSLLS